MAVAAPSSPTSSTAGAPAVSGLHVVHSPGVVTDDEHLAPGQCHARTAANGEPLPDPACTPGAIDPAVTQANISSTICRSGYTSTVRPPASDTGRWKIRTYLYYAWLSGAVAHGSLIKPTVSNVWSVTWRTGVLFLFLAAIGVSISALWRMAGYALKPAVRRGHRQSATGPSAEAS